MKTLIKKQNRRPISLMKKIVLCILSTVLVVGIIYLTYYVIHYLAYNKYRDYLTSYDYETGEEYQPVKENKTDVAGMELVCENEYLKLYTDTTTAAVAVYDKRNGEISYSNPPGAEEDGIANDANMNYLKSQFILNYYNPEVKSGTYDSYSMAVEKGQITAQSLENGLRYIYRLGDFNSSKTGIIPLYITQEKLEEIRGKLSEKDSVSLERYYIESTTTKDMLELNGVVKKNPKTIKKIQEWLEKIGWTNEEYEEQMELAGVETTLPISFQVPLEYRLMEDGLKVSIPVSAIEEYGGGSIYRIQLLRYMAAADSTENGYMVVPNGSGSLIDFNNGKINAASYSQYIYDLDPLSANYTTTENSISAKLPLFGICRENSSVLVTIESGASLSLITAGISGVYNEYNYAYPTFVLRSVDNLRMFGNTSQDVLVLEPELYDANLEVKYTFLTEEYKGYAGLAGYYRERLIAEGVLTPGTLTGDIPFYYDIISGVKETAHFLGKQYLHTFSMTTFDQAAKISEELSAQGINNQVMNLQGWFNGGYYHNTADKIKIPGKLGGKSDLESLNETLEKNGGRLYADVALQQITYADKDFNYNAEASKYYGAGYVVALGQVNPTTLRSTSSLGYMETVYNLLSPRYLPRYVSKFTEEINGYDIEGISLRDLGNVVYSDKKRTNIIDREEALKVVLGQLDLLKGTGKKLMTNGANDYSFAYSSDIINVPIEQNDFLLVDERIPLYEMILHGSISYSTELLNYEDKEGMNETVLKMIESGAAPHYIFTWEESNKMKNTGLNRYYATTFGVWKADAIAIYNQVNEPLSQVRGSVMQNHEILSNGVRKVTYSNGIVIYINYSDEVQMTDGYEVPAKGYRLEERK
ncbi:MAG: hypothetical protein K0R05_203 [Anaerocolumna sp.]|nr:hypothetical protein [Anaerocolumna sp.]